MECVIAEVSFAPPDDERPNTRRKSSRIYFNDNTIYPHKTKDIARIVNAIFSHEHINTGEKIRPKIPEHFNFKSKIIANPYITLFRSSYMTNIVCRSLICLAPEPSTRCLGALNCGAAWHRWRLAAPNTALVCRPARRAPPLGRTARWTYM